jgi:hypothetical protein
MQPFAVAVYEAGHLSFIPRLAAKPGAFQRLRQSSGTEVPPVPESVL